MDPPSNSRQPRRTPGHNCRLQEGSVLFHGTASILQISVHVAHGYMFGDAPRPMSDNSESPKPAAPAPTEKKRAPRPAKPPLPDEKLIDSPTRPTLIILGAISLATLVMWGAGRAACNYRVPGESLTPRAVSLQERTALPKGVGLEFSQALSSGDFATARQLATGAALGQVEREATECGEGCGARTKMKDALATVADLLQVNAGEAYVRTRSSTPSGHLAERLLHIGRDGQHWRVTEVLPANGPVPHLTVAKQGVSPFGEASPARPTDRR